MKNSELKKILTVLILIASAVFIYMAAAGTEKAGKDPGDQARVNPPETTGLRPEGEDSAEEVSGPTEGRPQKRGSRQVLNFIERELVNEDGGIMTGYLPEKGVPLKNTDVLSESQGLVMEYAVGIRDKALFDKCFNYVNGKMRKDPLIAWVVTEKGPARVNSSVDDLRIYRVLRKAESIWGGYSQMLDNLERALRRYNTQDHRLVNQYDFKYRKKSDKLKLGFADFEALKLLGDSNPLWEQVCQNSLTTVENGYISGSFPVYYSEYDYSGKNYIQGDINMAEGMVTIVHLAKINKLRPETLKWLRRAIDGDGIFARYKTDGTVSPVGRYESTAIYGLACMAAKYAGDTELAEKALARMEAMQISRPGQKIDGAFGNSDGTGIYSFDQCIGLLAYGTVEGSEEK